MLNVGIVGATGHTGEILTGILFKHPNVRIAGLYNTGSSSQPASEGASVFKKKGIPACKKLDLREIAANCDLVFLALPHTVSMAVAPQLLRAGKRVIDLSADYRLQDVKTYEAFYKARHLDKINLPQAVYGLPELYRQKIKHAKLVANPGCYPTAALLGLAPLVALNFADLDSIIIDAKSGVSGAGKKLSQELLFREVNEDFKAYKVGVHQHAPEIDQILSGLAGKKTEATFVPHLLPLDRGLLETIYVKKAHNAQHTTHNAVSLYKKFYKNEPFIRIYPEGEFPRIKDVAKTNLCAIGIKEQERKIIIISAIDNLLKGASGQAVENMNIMYGFPETAGLL